MRRPDPTPLHGQHYDVAIIGGGINGASSAQHLAAAGYRVILIEKKDFGSGSTQRSTRVLHCGLRYFETPRPLRDFALSPKKLAISLRMARASMQMRDELATDSPSRVRPITLVIPILKDGPYPGWMVDLAFRILGRWQGGTPLDYRRLSAKDARTLPFIRDMEDQSRLRSAALFTEYVFRWPPRLAVDAILDAERMGATVLNHCEATLNTWTGSAWRIDLGDGVRVSASLVLNTAGIWIDQVNADAGNAPRLIFGTKGAHLVARLPEENADYGMTAINSVGEPHYIVPTEGGLHTIGPTETAYHGNLDDIRVDPEDREFLLAETRALFPRLPLDDIVYGWAGVRPLGYDPAFPKGKRSLELHDLSNRGLPGVHAVTAGPIMTHRQAGRDVIQAVRSRLDPTGPAQTPDYTPRQPPDNPNSPRLVPGDASVRLSDLAHAATTEHAATLTDAILGRTTAALNHRLTDDQLRRGAEAMAAHLGWTPEETEAEVRATRQALTDTFLMPRA